MKLAELAQRLGCEMRGDGEVEISRAAPIETAGPGEISFVANKKYQSYLSATKASALALPSSEGWNELPSLR
ncbi:MAG: LpxD N-terminal domain-containing protein, partial [Candidatus Zixiibacteriota bacterium]